MNTVISVDKSIINDGLIKAGNDFTQRLSKLGFERTEKWYWVRLHQNYADFVHLHRHGSSYGGQLNYSISLRVYCGNRVFNDSFEAIALNGPNSDSSDAIGRRYHLRFNAKSGSTYDRCIDDLEKFVVEICEPWLISHKPAGDNGNEQNIESMRLSFKILGIKRVF